ncbi:hypothetical protein MBLNU457_6116t1 [Dothideomycetes sp. NU457]
MSTTGSFSTKNPTIKRILKEASELQTQPSADFTASPLETNLFEWHFTLRGPPTPSPFAGGLYHGRIVLPPSYPLRPPSFRFLTPSGRFEPNREICLSISGFHEETWQPAWGIRTALVAIRSFMDSDAGGQVGGMSTGEEVRRRLARESRGWRCAGCGGRSNEEVMVELEERCKEEGGSKEEEKVPDELRLEFRDQLGKEGNGQSGAKQKEAVPKSEHTPVRDSGAPLAQPVATSSAAEVQTRPVTRAVPPSTAQVAAQVRQQRSPDTGLLDKAIVGVAIALVFMILRVMA